MRNIKKSILVLLVVSFAFVILTPLTAQELILSKIYMKDGNVFVGEITRYESGIITIKTEYGTFNLDDSKVKYITVSESELKESYKEPCIVLKDGKVIPGKVSSYISVLKRVKVSSNYGDVTIDRFKDIALIVLEPVEGKPWLSGWAYRKKITIAGSAGAGTNYQVLLKIGESSGASGADFNLEGSSAKFPSGKNDGGDLRFTASDGATLQDFWVESVNGTSPNRVAYVWVEVSEDLGTNRDIYVYFGNPNATNVSNGANTFLFFDDFATFSGWSTWGTFQTLSTDGDLLHIQVTSGDAGFYRTDVNFSNICYESRTKIVSQEPASPITRVQNASNFYLFSWFFYQGEGICIRKRAGDSYITLAGDVWLGPASSVFKKARVTNIGSNLKIEIYSDDWGTLLASNNTTDTSFTSGGIGFRQYPFADGYLDWARVRKYASPEPAFSSAGAEEKRN